MLPLWLTVFFVSLSLIEGAYHIKVGVAFIFLSLQACVEDLDDIFVGERDISL